MKPKLVRDKIPSIIANNNKNAITHQAGIAEAKQMTIAKMYEEVAEFEDKPSIEEAADIYQVFMAMIRVHNISWDDVITAAVTKAYHRGRFDSMIILDGVTNKDE